MQTQIDKPPNRTSNMGALFVAAAVSLWLLVPPLFGTYRADTSAIFHFFLQDTFYYLSVAANSATGFYTFDGQTATTGFHPLWQAYLTKLFELAPRDQTFQIHLVFWVSVLASLFGYVLAGLAVYNATKSKLLGILIVPGFFNLMFLFVFQFAASPWSFMNGMESPMTVLFGGALFLLISFHFNDPESLENRKSFYLLLGIALSLIAMSRLDDVFAPAAFAFCILILRRQPLKTRFARAVLLLMPTVLLMALFLGFNYYSTQMFLPVSGIAKGGIAIIQNIGALLKTMSLEGVGSQITSVAHLSDLYRQLQMLFPLLGAVLFLLIIVDGMAAGATEKYVFLAGLLVYVCFKSLYNLVNVDVNYQGVVWYYVLSMLVFNFIGLLLLSKSYWRFCEFNRPIKVAALAAVVFYMSAHLNIMSMITIGGNTLEYNFWSARKVIASDLRERRPDVKIVEYEDGIINYSLGMPTIHGIGFVVDKAGFEARKAGRMLGYAYSRGFNTIGSLVYVRLPNENMSSAEIESSLRRSPYFRGEDLENFAFRVLFIHRGTGATFIEFQPK
jgi:hypothetical protein